MLFDVRATFVDYNGQEATTGITIEGAHSLAAVDAFVVLFASTVAGLSDGYNASAKASTTFKGFSRPAPVGLGSVRTKLLILCRNNGQYASFKVAAPASVPLLSSGPFAGVKVDKGAPTGLEGITALVAYIAGTQTPYGASFPAADWEAALIQADDG